ncbi:hypothetical protein [Sulfurovum sp. NBC37-1]|uniref:hypothetical protein n=1 Tax=Sulfurovum sp. (strain NBC37-1) TaxID=387093 RepID=UPI0001587CA1|nr:hypothetical protein [Sulfurovum sp. NBC37-1]BAF73134.1 hypothetical protein SUN_2194 [Sulfurovum sp. NBC37-1]
MKKALLLSVVASVAVMAGGDIAPAPVVEETSNWDWSGTAKVYYQTMDHENYWFNAGGAAKVVGPSGDMFDRYTSAADAGIQLRVNNKDVIAGIGFGAELTGLSTLNLVNFGVVTASMQSAADGDVTGNPGDPDNMLSSAWVSQAYLTYGFGNTSFKLGRQELPKSLSPFAFSEGWNVFKNTFEAALVVNTDLPNTTLVGAYVNRANGSLSWAGSIVAITAYTGANHGAGDLSDWRNVGDNGTYMLTAQNKSIEGLTATGTFYYAPGFAKNGVISTNNSYMSGVGYALAGASINNGNDSDAMVLWGDLAYKNSDFPIEGAIQGGFIDADNTLDIDKTTAFGGKLAGHFGDFTVGAAYTTVDIDDDIAVLTVNNFGTGVKSPLYTQMVLNQIFIDGHFGDSDTWQVKGSYKGLGGKFIAAYGSSSCDFKANDYNELDLIYATKFNTAYGDIGLKAMWINQDFDGFTVNKVESDDTNNVLRLIASYDF